MSSRAKRKQAARAAAPQPRIDAPAPARPEVPAAARWMAALCYLNILILIPACSRWRHHDFVRFHLNQGLVLLAMIVVFAAMGFVPYCYEFSVSCSLLVEVMSIVGLVTALRRKTDPLPVIRNVTRNFHPF